MNRIPVLLPLLLLAASAAAQADLREIDQKILEYNVAQARAALAGAGAEPEKLAAEGRILGLEKKWAEGEAKLRRATELKADDPAIWNHLGELRERAGNAAGAREAFQRASNLARTRVEGGASGADSHYQLGRALQGLRSFDGAAEHLGHAQKAGAPLATYQLGVLRASQERWQESVDILSQALGANSGIAYAYYYRGLAASKVGRKDLLINDLGRFLQLAPNAPEADRVRRMLQSAKR
ncbi:MAG TPA: tetratricopeptide repeat protein [Thermoanaerobaculia bacterium]|nr:tetratricopeptide repeat protein [Thermoanaerobaculia bacterium]